MKINGTYKQKYTLDREAKELVVMVKLHKREGMIKAGQNLYYGTATVDDKEINHSALPSCVNALYMAERIGKEMINSLRIKANLENKIFRLKRKRK